MLKPTSASDAVALIQPGQRLFVHGGVATPNLLLDALVEQHARLRDVEIVHLHTTGPARYADKDLAGSFRVANLFVGPNMRSKMDGGRVDYIPCFLSEIPSSFARGAARLTSRCCSSPRPTATVTARSARAWTSPSPPSSRRT